MSLYCHVALMLMVLPSQALESIFTCMNMTEECPLASEWDDKTKQYKCFGNWQYVCMLGKGSVLLEGCMPNKSILVGTHGCPFVEKCDTDLLFSQGGWPILSDKGFIPCESLERCPGQNHTVSVFDIKNFSECLTLKKRKMSTVPLSMITYDATSTTLDNLNENSTDNDATSPTRDNLNENNVGNSNTRTVVLSVVLPVVFIAVLLAAGVVCYMNRRGKIACARKDPEKQTNREEIGLEERKKQGDTKVEPDRTDLKESEEEKEPLVTKNVDNSVSKEDLSINQVVNEPCKPSISTATTDRGIQAVSPKRSSKTIENEPLVSKNSENEPLVSKNTENEPLVSKNTDNSVCNQDLSINQVVDEPCATFISTASTERETVSPRTPITEKESTSAASSVDQMSSQRDGIEEHQDTRIQTLLASPVGDITENESIHDTSMENTLVVPNEEFDCKSLGEEDDKEKEYTNVDVSVQWNHYCTRVTQSNTGCAVKCEEQAESYCDTCRLKNLYCKNCGIKHSKNHKEHGVIPKINFGQRCNVHKGVPFSRWCSECKYLCFECLRTHRCEGQLQNLKVRLDTLIRLIATKNESIKLKADLKDKDFKHLMDKRNILVSKMETLAQSDYKQLLFANMRDRNAVENQIMELMDRIRSNEAAMKEQCLNVLEGLVLVDIDTVGEWRETYAAISHPLQTLK